MYWSQSTLINKQNLELRSKHDQLGIILGIFFFKVSDKKYWNCIFFYFRLNKKKSIITKGQIVFLKNFKEKNS